MERSTVPRNTLKDLEEFRKRKLAERETARGMSSSGKSPELSCGIPSQSGSRDQKPLIKSNVEAFPVPQSERNQRALRGNQHSSVISRISSWLYDMVMPENVAERAVIPEPVDTRSNESDEEDTDLPQPSPVDKSWSAWIKRFLHSYGLWWTLAWMCGFLLAVRFGWGAVYFALSVLVIIWKGLSDSRKAKRGALSAYSVFNPNCERIEGTIDAEQLQRTMFLRF